MLGVCEQGAYHDCEETAILPVHLRPETTHVAPTGTIYFEMECFILRRTFGKCSSSKRSRESVALILGTPSGYQLAIRAGAIVPRRRNILY